MDTKEHWERVYSTRDDTEVSWYQPHLGRSLELILGTGVGTNEAVIDVGGGASTLVDDLVERGFADVTALDLSGEALGHVRERLGDGAGRVHLIEADITQVELPHHHYAVWHDRAVFHFLRDPEQRQAYIDRVRHAVRPGGHVIVACFGPDGPERCSGLEVMRYAPGELHATFGDAFALVQSETELHRTPVGNTQSFVYCLCRIEPKGE